MLVTDADGFVWKPVDAAAIVAHDLGSSTVVLEKADKLGGLCGFGGGEVFVPANEPMLARWPP